MQPDEFGWLLGSSYHLILATGFFAAFGLVASSYFPTTYSTSFLEYAITEISFVYQYKTDDIFYNLIKF